MPSPYVVVLTGAGVSAESGLKTFRDNDGLWENHRVEEVATPEAFEANPDMVYRFYNERRAQLVSGDVNPNLAHDALVRLEQALGDRFVLVTQNVDDLHERAGSKQVIHMHGELLSARCVKSGKTLSFNASFDAKSECECCHPPSQLRPDIVWFGEMPLAMETIFQHLAKATLFIAIGTSGQVYPAANFYQIAAANGAKTVELNLEPSHGASFFDEVVNGPATKVVPAYVNQLIAAL